MNGELISIIIGIDGIEQLGPVFFTSTQQQQHPLGLGFDLPIILGKKKQT